MRPDAKECSVIRSIILLIPSQNPTNFYLEHRSQFSRLFQVEGEGSDWEERKGPLQVLAMFSFSNWMSVCFVIIHQAVHLCFMYFSISEEEKKTGEGVVN